MKAGCSFSKPKIWATVCVLAQPLIARLHTFAIYKRSLWTSLMSRSSPLTRYNKAESRSPFSPEMCAATKRANELEWEQDVECVQRATLTPRMKLQQVNLPALARPVNALYCPCTMYTLSRMIQFKTVFLQHIYTPERQSFCMRGCVTHYVNSLTEYLNNSGLGWKEIFCIWDYLFKR